jgi:hypothetical protein
MEFRASLVVLLLTAPTIFAQSTVEQTQKSPAPPPTGNVQSSQSTAVSDEATDTSIPSQCESIANMGGQYQPLASACEFVLSPQNLPNYVCHETTERFVNERKLDVITDDVRFDNHGRGERHTNLAVDGLPVRTLEDRGGWISFALFGNRVTTIFSPANHAQFRFEREKHAGESATDTFSFNIHAATNETFLLNRFQTGVKGSITVDKATGQLLEIESSQSERPANDPLESYKSRINYGDVTIPDLGSVLVPLNAEVRVCYSNGTCDRNQVAFSDCHKFKATTRIVPDSK